MAVYKGLWNPYKNRTYLCTQLINAPFTNKKPSFGDGILL